MKKFILFVLIVVGLYGLLKPLPEGINIAGEVYSVPASSITFYSDVTYVDGEGSRHSEQEIFDEIFRMIEGAEHYILLDFFLYNDFLGTATTSYRELSQELTNLLIEKKETHPEIKIVFITDTINEIYGGYESQQIKKLKESGVEIVITDLRKLRDSNPLYSAWWRTFFQWFGNSNREGIVANPFDSRGQKLSIRTYLSLLNFKANHRKVVMADARIGGETKLSVLVTSANPHDGSSAHTNTALKVDDYLWRDVLKSEREVANFSGVPFLEPDSDLLDSIVDTEGNFSVQLITEMKIQEKVVGSIDGLGKGNTLDMAMFYLSDRKVIKALKRADKRGAVIRILLDPNKDAFGRKKNGVPNRPVARELLKNSSGNTSIRWCSTHGEQCHTKLLLFKTEGGYTMIQGSANLTRRNIGNYNLETNVILKSAGLVEGMKDAYIYFDTVWENEPGRTYSLEYAFYKDESLFKVFLYHFMERVGTSSF